MCRIRLLFAAFTLTFAMALAQAPATDLAARLRPLDGYMVKGGCAIPSRPLWKVRVNVERKSV